ncbi:MAG: hypothetical protein K0Q49_1251 [Haloplasmataceae bacterium]|jgi:hypothetical protein|nr:hypothetical protein [Haloplasmataceae bacterium]
MILKITDDIVLEIRGNRNNFSISYINDNLIYLLPLFIEIIEFNKKYISKYYDRLTKKYFNFLTLAPYDFYIFAQANFNNSRLLITQTEYYAYQLYNLLLLPETEEVAIKEKWQKQNEMDSRFHNMGTGGYKNKKYLLKDIHNGYLEAVYNEDGKIVLDHINDGTYNLYHKSSLHSIDIILWLMYGVLSYDLFSMNQRVTILKSNLLDIYHFKL